MFSGCTSLKTAPVLPATTLVKSCYESMFSGCTLLNSMKVLFTDWLEGSATLNWLLNVSSSGTFKKLSTLKIMQGS
jgi:hypothetical protein